jgi:hypothetical protein
MKKALSYGLIAAMLLSGVIFACSDRKEPAAEKSAIKKMTEETAREAVNPDPHSHRQGPFRRATAGRKK